MCFFYDAAFPSQRYLWSRLCFKETIMAAKCFPHVEIKKNAFVWCRTALLFKLLKMKRVLLVK